jgi:hypothetical protein
MAEIVNSFIFNSDRAVHSVRAVLWRWFGMAGAAIVMLIVLLSLPVLFAGTDVEAGRTNADWVNRKVAASAALTSKRIVLLGGSNTLYGFSAEMITSQTGRPALNAGLNAGFGLKYLLHIGRNIAKPGDLFVLPLEYPLFEKAQVHDSAIFQFISHDQAWLKSLSWLERFEFAWAVRIKHWQYYYLSSQNPPAPVAIGARLPGAPLLNDVGDVIDADSASITPQMREAVKNETIRVWKLDNDALNVLQKFAEDLQALDITVIVIPPNVHERMLNSTANKAFFEQLSRAMADRGITTLGDPQLFLFNDNCAYDTNWHLTRPCQIKHTKKLIQLLKDAGRIAPPE